MNYIYSKISLDVQNIASQLTVSVKRGDTTRGLIISLTDNGKVYNIPDYCFATFSARKSDGTFLDGSCTIKNNKIIYEFSEQLTAVAGRVDCDIGLYDSNSERLVSPLFTVFVYETIKSEYSSKVVSSDEFTMLTDLISQATEAIGTANQTIDIANQTIDEANQTIDTANKTIETANQTIDEANETLDEADELIDRLGKGELGAVGFIESNQKKICKMWVGTQEEYEALTEIDSQTYYWITDDTTFDFFLDKINATIESMNTLSDGLESGDFTVAKADEASKALEADKLGGWWTALGTCDVNFEGSTFDVLQDITIPEGLKLSTGLYAISISSDYCINTVLLRVISDKVTTSSMSDFYTVLGSVEIHGFICIHYNAATHEAKLVCRAYDNQIETDASYVDTTLQFNVLKLSDAAGWY